MIRSCLTLFRGIGPERERALRASGIRHWQHLLDAGALAALPERLRRPVRAQVQEWSRAIEARDAGFFGTRLPRAAHWMLFEAFGDAVRYLDIETTGLSPRRHDVTLVGIFDGRSYQCLVRGQGLTAEALEEALAGCKLLVTYFGSQFDVPFLRAAFPEVSWDPPHFDLCFGGRRVGLRGGLKGVERTLGIERDRAIAEVDGYEAVRLWRAHQRGDATALQRLAQYNEADTRNLAHIAPIVYARLCQKALA